MTNSSPRIGVGAAAPQTLGCNPMLCCTVNEESGVTGIKRFVELERKIDGAIVRAPCEELNYYYE